MTAKKTILWVEDDEYYKARVRPMLEVSGFQVLQAVNARSAMRMLKSGKPRVDLVILDVAMPDGGVFDKLSSKGGHETGLLLGGWIHDNYKHIPIVGFSINSTPEILDWFREHSAGYFRKGEQTWTLVNHIKKLLGAGQSRSRGPRVFIVHGHDQSLVGDLKKFLTKTLNRAEIVVLMDLAGEGRTIIEKFEETAEMVDLAFVLLTPDDMAYPCSAPNHVRGRARQNVVFELGYFYAKLQRTKGKVVVLCKGDVERPSDIAGIEYIDVTGGISKASSKLKQEMSNWIS